MTRVSKVKALTAKAEVTTSTWDRQKFTQKRGKIRQGRPLHRPFLPVSKVFLYLSLLFAFTVNHVLCDIDVDYDGDGEGPTAPEGVGTTADGPQLEFTMPTYLATIPENSVGKVYAIPDNIRMGIQCNDSSVSIKYRIKSGDKDNFFKAESERVGDFVFLMIRTRTNNLDVLNRERRSGYRLDIRAKARGPDHQRLKIPESRTYVNIEVTDSNDLDPFFQPSTYFYDVPEDIALHKVFGFVKAEDADSGINGEIYYSIMDSGDPEKTFAVDPVTGGLSVTRPLSFNSAPKHELTIVAQDRGAKSRFATRAPDTATVYITITQVNLHAPQMQVKHLPEVIENSNALIYAIIKVDDPDPGRHGEVDTLEILEGDQEGIFRIRPSESDTKEFNIEVLQMLDREVSPQGYNLTLRATDRGVPPRWADKNVHVRLGDFNDHSPVFDREVYEVSINESAPPGTPIVRLKVSDLDSGMNAKVKLSIVAGNKLGQFRINPNSGVLYVGRTLDADTRSTYTLTVTALDQANTGSRKQSSAKVRIIILDVNDNDPIFEDGFAKEVTFNENEPPGTKVYKVKATDADSGENGYISYSLANLDDVPFEIDHFTGVIKSTKLLDFESEKRVYVLQIRASDWGSPYRRQAEMKLTIQVSDINDNRPQFERIGCSGKVARTTAPGSRIFTLSALDFDAGAVITYKIVSGNSDGCFALDPTKGVLSVTCDLRTLPMRRRELNVTATDGQHFSDVMPVIVRLVNDDDEDGDGESMARSSKKKHKKMMTSGYSGDSSFECKETDVAKRLTLMLSESERNNIIPEFGDGDSESSNMPSRFGTNIHRPEIENLPGSIRIDETTQAGTLLVKVTAVDRDLGFNGDLLYVISDGDTDSVFRIDTNTGNLYVDGTLDRESTEEYNLNVTVFDQGIPQKSTSGVIQIIVNDINDNPPVFIKSNFHFFFPENTAVGTPVVTLNATDADSGLNGQVSYFLDTVTENFELNPQTGLLVLSKELDRETKEFYDLSVRAVDGAKDMPLSSYALVRVKVIDVNDVTPEFSSKTYVVKVREDVPFGTVVGMVHASDTDQFKGGLVKYSLVQKSEKHFDIDDLSGTIRVASRLDYEQRQIYNLTVRATDGGSPILTSTTSFVIEVIDVNENMFAPKFDSFFFRTAVPENMPTDSHVATVVAKDQDCQRAPDSDDCRIGYSINGGDGLGSFYVDEAGNIKTSVVLDRESKKSYWITIVAQDHAAVPLSSRLDVYIEVLNVNDNVPMTIEPIYFPKVFENSKPFTPIITLESFDGDDEGEDELKVSRTYEFVSGNPQSLFYIDPNTGSISTTNRLLDREVQSEHVLEVRVFDNGTPPLNSTSRIVVQVSDENDNKPEFLEKFYKVSVLETSVEEDGLIQNDEEKSDENGTNSNSTSENLITDEQLSKTWDASFENATWETFDVVFGKPLFRMVAFDLDEGDNGKLTFSLKAGRGVGKFQIDPNDGTVYATKTLRAGETYDMLVRASDRGTKPLSTLAQISLTIEGLPSASDANSHSPALSERSTRVSVIESDPVGHLVALISADDKDGDKLFYSLTSGDSDREFYVSPDKGAIVLAKMLNAERKNFYNLTVSVTDGRNIAQAEIFVTVIDSNEKRPEFSEGVTYELEVSENAPVGSTVIRLNVTDEDERQKIFFNFQTSQHVASINKFKIDPTTGEVTIKEKLDREKVQRHLLIVVAKDEGTPVKTNYAKLIIHVTDHNDHVPTFTSRLVQTRLHETAGVGTNVLEMMAVDGDFGENGRVNYTITSGNLGNAFSMDETIGMIKVAKRLDMTKQGEYMLMVKASDNGNPPLSSSIPVHILLTMADDAPPKFMKQHYAMEVYENLPKGKPVLSVEARGRSTLRYEITSGNIDSTFVINPSTGTIVTQKSLDFEQVHFYNITVTVSNLSGAKSNCTASIHVLDVNDNAPKFERTEFEGYVSESAALGSLVLSEVHFSPLVIKASDNDTGINSLLSFQILDDRTKKFFAIDESTGAIRTIASLDYEEQKVYKFKVRVSDRGNPSLTSESLARVTINILDENDSPPAFEKESYLAVLLLPTFRDVMVAQINATDPDKGVKTQLRYSIIGGNEDGKFKIDPMNGKIMVAKDNDIGMYYTLEMGVSDGRFSDRCIVKIDVKKSDNSGLVFAKERYQTSVLENSTKSDIILVVNVLGSALNENLQFTILNPSEYFRIGTTSGAIHTTGKPFDRETQERHELVIEVRSDDHDRVVPRVAHVIVDVEVIDINDNSPMFVNQPYYAVLAKDSPKESTVFKVTAIDKDKGNNGEIYYQLVKGPGEVFRVGRKTGLITLRAELENYEKEYKLTVAAYDGGTPPFNEEVMVYIKMVDKSVPVFGKRLYRSSVKEDVQQFTPLVTTTAESPTATDGDISNAKLIYTIESGNDAEKFSIDYSTGVISVLDSLDFEGKAHHQLTVRATDSVTSGYAETIVLFDVEDINDCAPRFSNDSYSVATSEAVPTGTVILKLSASDADSSGPNSEITFSILKDKTNSSDLFEIDSTSGELMLKRSLDRERQKRHHITVIATDKGAPRPLSSAVQIEINVLDSNDNTPEFEEAEYQVPLSDDAGRGQFVGKVRAVDLDEGGLLIYSIIGGNQHDIFAMNSTSGTISLVNLHSFGQTANYTLNVSVSDGVHSSSSKMKVNLVSSNSFAPTFEKQIHEVTFDENQAKGVQIAKISAFDPDRDDYILYSISNAELSANFFQIDPDSGEIWSVGSFDREIRPHFDVPIIATDRSGLSGFAVLKVRIGDVNDNAPMFDLDEYKANIHANLTVGSVIIRVRAVDQDEQHNARVTYSIYDKKSSGNVADIFEVDPNSGAIILKKSAAKLENQVYQFFIRAQDGGNPPLHSDAPIEIYIMSHMDRPPVFEKGESVIYLSENGPVGQVISTLKATLGRTEDRESDGGSIRYKLATAEYLQNDADPLFQIDKEGRIIVSSRLDREKRSTHKLTFLAETDTSPTLNAYHELTIQVLDKNDNSPKFVMNSYNLKVSEAVAIGTPIVQVIAEDADYGNNGEVKYSFFGASLPDIFSIDPHNGWITTQSLLDFEEKKSYNLQVMAVDNGNPSLTATAEVKIEVVDVNDNPPVFYQKHYTAAVNEGALPGTIIFALETEDKDTVAKTEVEYFITSGDNLGRFQVKKNGEVYVARKLDREAVASYHLVVVATDGTFVTSCKVTIEILDDNDSPPVCNQHFYREVISESVHPGTYILSITATDADEGSNARQIFYLTGDSADVFSLDRDTGMLKTSVTLDREKMSEYLLEAHVQDAGIPEWECVSKVEIEVSDSNDNSPVFSQDAFSASLKEDIPVGSIATKIHASDLDLGMNRKIEYDFLDSAGGHFRIDPSSGIVSLSKPLDREERAMYNLTVRATDNGRPRLSSVASLMILVLDVNDNPPEFASKYYFATVTENVAIGSDVVRLLATSRDAGVNAEITYSIIAGNEHRKFKINSKSGVLVVAGEIDHEASKDYFLTIQAQDGGDPPLSNHATVNITVQDLNDNPPIFARPSYTALIKESADIGNTVASVSANDMDYGENGRILYSIVGGDRHGQFSIDNLGIITVNKKLDREMTSSYVLDIEAADHGLPVMSSTVLVNVDIEDVNDNPPIFPDGNYTVFVQEDKQNGHILLRFSVTDADESPNSAPFTFDIRAGNEENAFRVVQDGTLRTATKFNHKLRNKYFLQVRVFDNGSPPLFSDTFVTVNIIEESQYPPALFPLEIGIISYQDDFPGAVVGRIKASDQDPYDKLTYEIVSLNSPANSMPSTQVLNEAQNLFEIDHSDGTIIALQGLDVGGYSLNISVSDGKFTSFTTARVNVNLLTDEMLSEAVIIRFAEIGPEEFVRDYLKPFVKMVRTMINVRSKDVEVLSIQPSFKRRTRSAEPTKAKRVVALKTDAFNEIQEKQQDTTSDLDVLFAIRKSKNEFVPREKVWQALDEKKLGAELNLKVVGFQEDECTEDRCESGSGKCKDVVIMDEGGNVLSVSTELNSFVAPRHRHRTACICKEGFAGDRCETILNECAREPCPIYMSCTPDTSLQGYSCHCPEGLTGPLCNINVTTCIHRKCSEINPISFSGKSYARYMMKRSLERHLSASIAVKTLYQQGTIMYAAGDVDYSILEVANSKIRYRFNFGSGEGIVTLDSVFVSDGEWHEISVERHGNGAKITVDRTHEAHGAAPGINDVLNLENTELFFGAQVIPNSNGYDLQRGFVGCLDDLRIDAVSLPLHVQAETRVAKLSSLNNVDFRCQQLSPPGICGTQPCLNGATCTEDGNESGYTCTCPPRFTGTNCEYDQDPCASNPCLHGANCINLRNDFHCECPEKLSGKRCHYGKYCNPNPCQNSGFCEEGVSGPICKCRGFTGTFCTVDVNECLNSNPCQHGGTCINSNGGFHCICPKDASGLYCSDILGKASGAPRDFAFRLEEMMGIIVGSLFVIVFIVICFVLCKRFSPIVKQERNGNGYQIQNEFGKETLAMHRVRSDYNNREHKLNNLELASQDSRPLIPPAIRPLSSFAQNQHETAFNYTETARNYGSAADDLEAATLRRPPQTEYIQNIVKPMAAVAPSICCHPSDHNTLPSGGIMLMSNPYMQNHANLMDNYFHPMKLNGKRPSPQRPTSFRPPSRLRVNMPASATDSPGLKGATSLSSLPTSNTEDTQKYYWDSFDLNGAEDQEQHPRLLTEVVAIPETIDNSSFVSSESNENNLLLPHPVPLPCLPNLSKIMAVDPTRDIDTLPEDDMTAKFIINAQSNNNENDDVASNAGSDDEPPLGAVYPPAAASNSLEELLALNDDINYADDDDEGHEAHNSYDYHLHLNNYLPTHNISEASETDEQTPMLGRRDISDYYRALSNTTSPNANFRKFPISPVKLPKSDLDSSSDFNRSITGLSEEIYPRRTATVHPPTSLRLPNFNNLGSPNVPNGQASAQSTNGDLDNLCELEESDDDCETPTIEVKPSTLTNTNNAHRVTQV